MQEQVTRPRLAGGLPHVMLVPRLGPIRLLAFSRVSEAIAEDGTFVAHALAQITRGLSRTRSAQNSSIEPVSGASSQT
jgi:hypothetical protein